MDRDVRISLKAQAHLAALDVEHRDFEHTLEAKGASDDDGLLGSPRQDQHGRPP
jgi:hypothetical protein